MHSNRLNNNLLNLCFFVLLLSINITAQNKETNFLTGIKINAFLSGSYQYNFNNPNDMKNNLRVFDYDNNSFKMDALQLSFHQDTDSNTAYGFRADLYTGSSIPRIVHSCGLNSGDIDIFQLYVTYILPVGKGIRFDFGKFATLLGYEVVEGWENYNDQFSHSFLFGYSIPYTHTGIKASYTFNEVVSAAAFIANGWDNAIDNNRSKTIGAQLALTPVSGLNIYSNFISGPEQDNNDSNIRSVLDIAASYDLNKITLGLNADLGWEDFSLPKSYTAQWSGLAAYIKYKLCDKFSLNFRGEIFKDNDGMRTGVAQILSEITFTPSYYLSNHFTIRAEFRYDNSDQSVFVSGNSTSSTQLTLGLNIIYHY